MAISQNILKELAIFLMPLRTAIEDPKELAELLEEIGFSLSSAQSTAVLAGIGNTFQQAFDQLSPPAGAGFDGAALLGAAFSAMRTITGQFATAAAADAGDLAARLFDYLLIVYLASNQPLVYVSLQAIGVISDEDDRQEVSPDPVVQAAKWRLSWNHLGDFVGDTGKWASDVYHWGSSAAAAPDRFQFERAIRNLVRISDAVDAGLAYLRNLPAGDVPKFVKNAGATKIPAGRLPLQQDVVNGYEPDHMPIFQNEAGIQVVPFGDLNKPEELGLAIAPYQKGAITASVPIPDTPLTLKVSVEPAARATPLAITLQPTGAGITGGAPTNATFELAIVRKEPGGASMILAGEPNATRVEASEVFGAVGGNLNGEFYVAGGVKKLKIVIDVADDGLLKFLLDALPGFELEAESILLGWRNGRGVYFESGSGLSLTIPIDKQLGPFHLFEIGLALAWDDGIATTATVTADARLGPLYAYVAGLGITVTLVPAPDGNGLLGNYDLEFKPKFPNAYGIALEAEPIAGGGYLEILDHEYRGALALKFEAFGFAAFAILTTKMPGGQPGFSFVASIFGDFTIPLGYGFFLTGLGGIIAINRTVDTDALRAVLSEGQLDSILFPADPIANAPTILENMAAIFPVKEGQFAFGPMARIAFSQPPLIEGKLGIILEIGSEFRLLILGAIGTHLPTRTTPIVVLEVSFFGEIDFGAGTISLDATLQNSRVLDWPISGDVAARTGWAPRIDHVISFGGLHPKYPRPSNLPELRRMSISFGTNNPRVSLWAYQAITLNSLQFGAGADLYAKGPDIPLVGVLAAEGSLAFDALIYFNPFSFEASLAGSLALLVDGDEVVGLHFRLTLTGPNDFHIDGKVWATVCGIDVDFKINERWGERRELPSVVADPIQILRDAIAASARLEPIAARNLSDGVRLRKADDGEVRPTSPTGGLRLSQRAIPLGVEIEKIGEAQIVGAARTFDLRLFTSAGAAVALDPAEMDFVRGHFWKMSDSDRLRAPAFERRKSGFEVASGDELVVDAARAIEVEYGYEVITIGDDEVADASPLLRFRRANGATFLDWMGSYQRSHAAPLDAPGQIKAAANAPSIHVVQFEAVGLPATKGQSFFAAGRAAHAAGAAGAMSRNPVIASYLVGN